MNFRKINARVNDMFEKGEFDNDFINTTISKENLRKLYDYQILHTYNIITCLKKTDVVLDGSSTGLGKSYTTACACKELKYEPVIICPKSIMNIWISVCDYFGLKTVAIVNYETIRSGQIYDSLGKRIDSPFLQVNKVNNTIEYKWNLDKKKNIIIFDEAHKCKNKNSQNGKLLLSTKNICKTILLSATLADTAENFIVFGYMLGLYSKLSQANNWISNIIKEDRNRLIGKKTSTLSKYLFPDKGSRMNIEDLGDKLPKNQIMADCYDLDKNARRDIDKQYDIIKQMYKSDGAELVAIQKSREKIELYKVPILFDQIQKYLENNKSVVVFVNFTQTLTTLSKLLSDNKTEFATIHGKQQVDERDIEINKFQTNTVRVILCMMQVGSLGINLQDTSGKHQRVSLICPSFSSVDLIQALGRIYRNGIATPVLQKIIFAANTYEQIICDKVRQKLKFINNLCDEDLGCF